MYALSIIPRLSVCPIRVCTVDSFEFGAHINRHSCHIDVKVKGQGHQAS